MMMYYCKCHMLLSISQFVQKNLKKWGGLTFWRRTINPGSCGGDAEVGKFRGVLKAPRNDPKLRKGSVASINQLQHDYLHYLSYHLSSVDVFVIRCFIYHGKTGLY